ncbi:sulfite exporter TauE/SafE family protein [Oscillatoria amoena NRMC-F 0135]|nr:sulfite exporter TauE/SafE family protein [Oscillatoria amoena NRMC-F 0135]
MFTAAFILGLTGSLHCVGMCGPLALQVGATQKNHVLRNRLLYNGGRIVTYTVLGLLVGMLGNLIEMSGWQGWFSIGVGALVLVVLFFGQIERWLLPRTTAFISTIKRGILHHLNRKNTWSSVLLGVLNGFLPCGLVYAAIVLSLIQNTWMESALVMFVFGLGTVPALLVTVYTAHSLLRKIPVPLQKIQHVFVAGMALIMIWRGISLEGLFSIDQTVLCYPFH